MDNKVRTGQWFVIGIIVVFLGLSLLSIAVYNLGNGPDKLLTQMVRFLITAGLCTLLYQGHGLVRWLLGILAVLAGVSGIVGALSMLSMGDPVIMFIGIVFMLPFAVLYLACAGFLFFSSSVRGVMQHQRTRRAGAA